LALLFVQRCRKSLPKVERIMAIATFESHENGEAYRLVARGAWTLESGLNEVDRELRRFADRTMGVPLDIDISDIDDLDTAGAMALQRTMRACGMRDQMSDSALHGFAGVRGEYESLLQVAKDTLGPCEVDPDTGSAFLNMLERLGRGAESVAREVIDIVGFIGEVLVTFWRIIKKPSRFRLTPMVHHMEVSGLDATLIVGLMSFLIGAVIAFMGIEVLSQFGAEIFTVEMIGITVLREFGVLLTAILIAGRSGSSFTAAIGSMKLREEIDAMEAMGIDPMEALVVPRTLAMILVLPMLAFLAAMLGLLGGGLISWWSIDISPALFLSRTQEMVVFDNFFVGIVKAPFFAFFISIIGCYHGMRVRGSAEELGNRTTMSVVQSLFIVILLDALFAIFFLEIGI
jgi:phospholipid/cholesterol/gamma-HCH transport system permease protein